MKISLLILLLFAFFNGKGFATTPWTYAFSWFYRDLGFGRISRMNSTRFDTNNGKAQDATDLRCNFEQEGNCCWTNANDPGFLHFIQVSGHDPAGYNARKYSKRIFGTNRAPKGKFATALSSEEDTKEPHALFLSCALDCVLEPLLLRAKIWKSSATLVEACIVPVGGTPDNCVPFVGTPPNMALVLLPFLDPHHIVIRARGFRERQTVFMMDDIEVDAERCDETTLGPETTEPPPPRERPFCDPYSKLFTQGLWEPIASQDFVGMKSPPFRLSKPSAVGIFYQKGAEFKFCINDENDCRFQSKKGIAVEGDVWEACRINLDPDDGEQTVLFLCDKEQGRNNATCGIEIVLIYDGNVSPPMCL